MKRRQFLISAGVTGALLPLIARAQSKPCPPAALSVEGGSETRATCATGDAEADWLARATGPGVLWAHDFRTESEFNNYLKASPAPYEGSTITNPIENSSDPRRVLNVPKFVDTPWGASRAFRSEAVGTHLLEDVPSGAQGDVQVWKVADVSLFPDVVAPYNVLVGTSGLVWEGATWNAGVEYVQIQSIDRARNTLTVKRKARNDGAKQPPPYSAGVTTIGLGPQGRWIRPTGCFRAGQNGLATDDRGIVTGAARKARSWDKTNPSAHFHFREAYFGHRSYWDGASAQYDTWTPGDNKPTVTQAYEGDEFWVQFRARISASRFDSTSPVGKMLFFQTPNTSNLGQVFWTIGPQASNRTTPVNWPYLPAGKMFQPCVAYGDSRAVYGGVVGWKTQTHGEGSQGVQYQNPGVFPDAYLSPTHTTMRGWCFPADRWVTYLVHFKPGRDSATRTVALSSLVQELPAITYDDKPSVTLRLKDVSQFPDACIGWYLSTYKVVDGQRYDEQFLVQSIDRANNTITVQRNGFRYNNTGAAVGWDAGAPIVYGCYDKFPGFEGKWQRAFRMERDPNLGYRESTLEVLVAVEGEKEYTKLAGGTELAWLWGETYGSYYYNPPGISSVELGQNLNDYIGSGSVKPPSTGRHYVDYTQVICSRNFIPCPQA